LFDAGALVRSWTMRGTIHTLPARDLPWVLSVTAGRQLAPGNQRLAGLADGDLARAERAVRAALAGGNRLTRDEVAAVLAGIGLGPLAQRGAFYALAVRAVLALGPVVPRASGPSREQFAVLVEDAVPAPAAPADPLAEFFVRYITGHGPATAADFAWWSGLTLGVARRAAEAAAGRLERVEGDGAEPAYRARPGPRRVPGAPAVIALPSFDEYVIGYAPKGRSACRPEHAPRVGPGPNGLVRPVLLAAGEVIGAWSHSRAAGRHGQAPVPELFAAGGRSPALPAVAPGAVEAALARYAAFLRR
jgi:hypothetical protein